MPAVKREIVAEAAVWIAKLHGPDRTRAMELACLAWQKQSAEHRLAFERCSDTWQDVGGLGQDALTVPHPAPAETNQATTSPVLRRVLVGAALGLVTAAAALLLSPGEHYTTDVGEQLAVVLADGTRMTLNTASDVRVDLTKAQRMVEVRRGEALFQVAKDATWPFIVRVADASVTATGTTFLVQAQQPGQSSNGFGVTLIEGQVVVKRSRSGADASVESLVMTPGERVHVPAGTRASNPRMKLDRPQIDRLVAWQRGDVEFDATNLQDAAAEMNRYSKVKIVLIDAAQLDAYRISGVYRTGNNVAFADAVAALYGLVVSRRGDEVRLSKPMQR